MNDRRFDKLQTLFQAALELPESQRADWLAEQCEGDDTLLQQARRLLEHDQRETEFLEENAVRAMKNGLQQAGEDRTGEPGPIATTSSPDLQSFLSSLVETGLLGEAEVDTIRSQHASDDTVTLARKLVADQKLTQYQAQLLLSGTSQPLKLGNYLILDEIGAGGMGRVYLAEHRRMKRKVALKVLPPKMTSDRHAVDRFQREVEAVAQLSHPNIVTAYDADQANDVHFFVMEFVDGCDLSELVKRQGPLSVEQALECLRQIATGLEYAHGQGVVHRDIKPGNLLLDTAGTIKILDMGLARYQTSQKKEDLTFSGMAMGTADFMSPEQGVNAKRADERSDIYSLGCTLYFLLTGKKMFGGESMVEKVMAHKNDPIPLLADACPQATPELESVFQKMVAKDPADRFPSATELLTAVMALAGMGQPVVLPGSPNSPLQLLAVRPELQSTQWREALVPRPESETFPSSLYDDTHASSAQPVTSGSGASRHRRTLLFGLGFAAVLMAAVVIEAKTRYGTLRVEVLDPGLSVKIDEDTIRFGEKHFSKRKRFGRYRLSVLVGGQPIPIDKGMVEIDDKTHQLYVQVGNTQIRSDQLTIARRGETLIRVSLQPIKAASAAVNGNTDSPQNFALEFDGEASYVLLPALPNVSNELTIDVRVKKTDRSLCNLLVAAGRAINVSARHEVYGDFRVLGTGWVRASPNVKSQAPDPGKTVLISLVSSGDNVAMYVDGRNVGSGVVKGTIQGVSDHPNVIGAIGIVPPTSGFLKGIIDEYRISKIARYTEDFTPLSRFTEDEHTLALYHFDEGSGNVLVDSSGNGHHGLIVGAKWVRVDEELRVLDRIDGDLNVLNDDLPAAKTSTHARPDDEAPDLSGDAELQHASHAWPKDQPAPAIAPFDPEQAKEHQQAWAEHLGVPLEFTNSLEMTLRLIPPGEFQMGTPEEEVERLIDETRDAMPRSESPPKHVTISKPFYLCAHETTKAQFREFVVATGYQSMPQRQGLGAVGFRQGEWVGKDPAFVWDGDDLGYAAQPAEDSPVVALTYDDVLAFCEWLSKREHATYRVPTEAEWEYACRAGTTGQWSIDDSEIIQRYAWIGGDGGRLPKAVATKLPNAFGIFDMHGNVFEWCSDQFSKDTISDADRIGIANEGDHAIRGGAYSYWPVDCRSASRRWLSYASVETGFRVIRELDPRPSRELKEAVQRADRLVAKAKTFLRAAGTKGDMRWPSDQPAAAIAPFVSQRAQQYQQAWSNHLDLGTETTNSIGMQMRLIPPGEFLMGISDESLRSLLSDAKAPKAHETFEERTRLETPQHKVSLTKPFYMAAHEVTRGQFREFMDEQTDFLTAKEKDGKGASGHRDEGWVASHPEFVWNGDPGFEQTDEHPVIAVTFDDAIAFCQWLSRKEGLTYRLPTEAEWEFACRAGTTGRWSTASDYETLGEHERVEKYGQGTVPVGSKTPNPFGLYDMHGNVSEWCQDWYLPYQQHAFIDPLDIHELGTRVVRGGNFDHSALGARSATRLPWPRFMAGTGTGFRIVRELELTVEQD